MNRVFDGSLPSSKSQDDDIHSGCHYSLTSIEEAKAFQSFWLLLSVQCVPASLTSKNTEVNLLLPKLTASDSSLTHAAPLYISVGQRENWPPNRKVSQIIPQVPTACIGNLIHHRISLSLSFYLACQDDIMHESSAAYK